VGFRDRRIMNGESRINDQTFLLPAAHPEPARGADPHLLTISRVLACLRTVGDFVGTLNQNWYHSVAELGWRPGRKTRVFPLPSDIDGYGENCWATNGIQEVACSIHVSSTSEIKGFFVFCTVIVEFGAKVWCQEIPIQ
jgi:hypothetical protein